MWAFLCPFFLRYEYEYACECVCVLLLLMLYFNINVLFLNRINIFPSCIYVIRVQKVFTLDSLSNIKGVSMCEYVCVYSI